MKGIISALCVCALVAFHQRPARAFETDQYNLPPTPLADIGNEVSEHVREKLFTAIEDLNAKIATQKRCVEQTPKETDACGSLSEAQVKLEYLRSDAAVAHEAYVRLGAGVPPFTSMGTWMDRHHFRGQPARYRTSYWKSIFLLVPHIYLTISPTVKMYGSEFGTDKIAHFFQQGYTYYKIYQQAMEDGRTPSEAEAKTIRWGQKSERTFYGTWVSGVYSNGDLFANYAGMRFYQRLTHEIKIGSQTYPAVFVLENGLWTWNGANENKQLLGPPFISDQLNEALNPSIFTDFLGIRTWVRHVVRKRSCSQWFTAYPGLSQAGLQQKSEALQTWHGEVYGFTESERFVTIANTCFDSGSR